MKSPDADSGDQAVGDRQNKHIAGDERKQIMKAAGETTGKVYEGPNSPVSVEIALLSLLCTGQYHAYVT